MMTRLSGVLLREPNGLKPVGLRVEVADATREAEQFVAKWPLELKARTARLELDGDTLKLIRPRGGLQELSFRLHPEDARLLRGSLSDPGQKHTIVSSSRTFGFVLLPQAVRGENVVDDPLEVLEER